MASLIIDLLPFLIFVLIAIVGPIVKAAKNARRQQTARQEELDRRLRGESEVSTRRARADEQMANRQADIERGRESLDSLRSGSESTTRPSPPTGDRPLTMAERIQMARQAQIQQRQGGGSPTARTSTPASPRSSTPSRQTPAGQRPPVAPRRPSRVNPVQPNRPRPTRTNPVASRPTPAPTRGPSAAPTRSGQSSTTGPRGGLAADARRRRREAAIARQASASRSTPEPQTSAPTRTIVSGGAASSERSLHDFEIADLRRMKPDVLKKVLAMKIVLDAPVALRDEEVPLNMPL